MRFFQHISALGRTAGAMLLLVALVALPAAAEDGILVIPDPWPEVEGWPQGETVSFPSRSPFSLAEIAGETAPEWTAQGHFFLPDGASASHPVPAVVLLHGAGGVLSSREMHYAAQFAEMGIAALVVDVFGARREVATGFVNRLIHITEAAMVTDAYAALAWLDRQPAIDGERVALIGFSYGGMTTVFAAYRQVAELLAGLEGPRFAAHIAFYGPCIARLRNVRTTGAPVLFLAGGRDAIVDQDRCKEIQDDLRRGGSHVENVLYPDGLHLWDGGFRGQRTVGRNLAPCRLEVGPDFSVIDLRSTLPMSNTFFRRMILGLCADADGYLMGRDDEVRAQSNAAMGRFLARAFNGEP